MDTQGDIKRDTHREGHTGGHRERHRERDDSRLAHRARRFGQKKHAHSEKNAQKKKLKP